jgi:hypothetical protein
MECKICFEKYDQQLRKPVSINCGHSFCNTCLSSLKVSNSYACPTCRQSITNEQPNYTVLDLLDLNLIVDPNSLLKENINESLKKIHEKNRNLHINCVKKLNEINIQLETANSVINEKTTKLINKIISRKNFLSGEADQISKNLSEKVKKILSNSNEITASTSLIDLNSFGKKELESIMAKLNDKIKNIDSNQNNLDQIQKLMGYIDSKIAMIDDSNLDSLPLLSEKFVSNLVLNLKSFFKLRV